MKDAPMSNSAAIECVASAGPISGAAFDTRLMTNPFGWL